MSSFEGQFALFSPPTFLFSLYLFLVFLPSMQMSATFLAIAALLITNIIVDTMQAAGPSLGVSTYVIHSTAGIDGNTGRAKSSRWLPLALEHEEASPAGRESLRHAVGSTTTGQSDAGARRKTPAPLLPPPCPSVVTSTRSTWEHRQARCLDTARSTTDGGFTSNMVVSTSLFGFFLFILLLRAVVYCIDRRPRGFHKTIQKTQIQIPLLANCTEPAAAC